MFLILLALLVALLVYYIKHVYSYWERKGIPYLKPDIPYGNLKGIFKKRESFSAILLNLYRESTGPLVGVYLLFRPSLMIRDADLAKDILTKNFANFHDRGVHFDEKNDPMSANLFALPGAKWKSLRAKLSPAFTSGKLKSMFPTIEAIGKTMINHIECKIDTTQEFEMKNLLTRYAVDIIQNIIFGIEADTISNPNSQFIKVSNELFFGGIVSRLRGIGSFLCPEFLKFFGMAGLPPIVSDFMVNLVKETIEQREKSNGIRKDLMQLLIQLRNTGDVKADGDWDIKSNDSSTKTMSIEECAAQAFLFHIAGSETSASTAVYCIFEACRNEEIRRKLENDIEETLKKHDKKLTYECIQEMKYLDFCILETIRKYPGLPMLNRECTESFKVPGTKYVIEKGTSIIIPSIAIHRDDKYFPNAMQFVPERHSEEKIDFSESAFMPFGDGPRICIGLRLGKITSKVAVILLLSNFNFEVLDKREIEFAVESVPMQPRYGVPMKITRKENPFL